MFPSFRVYQLRHRKLEKLTPHHFALQSAYLKQQKENMDNATALILMDFAENFISCPG